MRIRYKGKLIESAETSAGLLYANIIAVSFLFTITTDNPLYLLLGIVAPLAIAIVVLFIVIMFFWTMDIINNIEITTRKRK